MFYLQKKLNQGTNNPILARISIALGDILNLSQLDSGKKLEIQELLFNMTIELIEANRYGIQVVKDIEQCIKEYESDNSLANSLAIPSALSLIQTRAFLKHTKASFRILGLIICVVFDLDFPEKNNGRFDLLKKNLNNELIIKLLELYEPWYKLINKFRNKDEHPKNGEDILINFELIKENGLLIIDKPKFSYEKNKVFIDEFVKASLHQNINFCEEVILTCLEEFLPSHFGIEEVAKLDRDLKCPIRFRVTLKS